MAGLADVNVNGNVATTDGDVKVDEDADDEQTIWF